MGINMCVFEKLSKKGCICPYCHRFYGWGKPCVINHMSGNTERKPSRSTTDCVWFDKKTNYGR